jgi:hypothetical protein
MSKKFLFLAIIIFFNSCAYHAPRALKSFPKTVPIDSIFEESVKSYGAYYQTDYSSIELNQMNNFGFSTTRMIHKRLKILNKKGYEYARLFIPKSESLKDLKITVEYPTGKKVNIRKSELKEITSPASLPILDDMKYYIFSVPGVEDGIVIDYSYSLELSSEFYFKHYFSADLPVKDYSTVLVAIDYWSHKLKTYNGLEKPKEVKLNEKKTSYIWNKSNLLPLENEAFSVPPKRLTPYYSFVVRTVVVRHELITHYLPIVTKWKSLNSYIFSDSKNTAWFSNNFKTELNKIREKLRKRNLSAEDIYNYVKENYEFKTGKNKDLSNPEKVVENHYGNYYGILKATFILFREAKLDPSYVLLKSYFTGDLDYNLPSPLEFDMVLPFVENVPVYISSKSYPFGKYPDVFEGTVAVKSENFSSSSKIELEDSKMRENVYRINITMDFDDEDTFSLMETFTGHQGYSKKDIFISKKLEKEKKDEYFQKRINRNWKNTNFEEYVVLDKDEATKPLKIHSTLKNEKIIESLGDESIIHIGHLFPDIYQSLISEKERKTDFYFRHANLDTVVIHFTFPKEKKVLFEKIDFDDIETDFLHQKIRFDKTNERFKIIYSGGLKKKEMPKSQAKYLKKFAENISKLRSIKLQLQE